MSHSPDYLTPDECEALSPAFSHLFPPSDSSRDKLLQIALAPLYITHEALKRDVAYQYVDFRDQRKLENALNTFNTELVKGGGKAKLEMTRSQVEDLKRYRKKIKEASKEADIEFKRDVLEKLPPQVPRLSDTLYMSQSAEKATKPRPLPSLNSFLPLLLPSPSQQTRALAEVCRTLRRDVPSTQETIISKYSMSRTQLDPLLEYRKKIMTAIKESAVEEKVRLPQLELEVRRAKDTIIDELARASSASPPFFEIPPSLAFQPSPPTSKAHESVNKSLAPICTEEEEETKSDAALHEMLVDSDSNRDIHSAFVETASAERGSHRALQKSAPAVDSSSRSSKGAAGGKKVSSLETYRLNPIKTNLPPLEADRRRSFASFQPSVTPGRAQTLAYSLEWNPLLDTSVSDPPVLELTSEELDSETDARLAARKFRTQLQTNESGSVQKELRKEVRRELEGLLAADEQEEDEYQDPFNLLERSRSTAAKAPSPPAASSSQTDLGHQLESMSPLDLPKTAIVQSPHSPTIPEPVSSFPPPYTLYKRRATSLPPSLSPLLLTTAPPPPLFTEINGQKMEMDEFGFVKVGFEITTSSPKTPINRRGMSRTDQLEVQGSISEMSAVGGRSQEVQEEREKPSGLAPSDGQRTDAVVVAEKGTEEKSRKEAGRLKTSRKASLSSNLEIIPRAKPTFRLSDSIDRLVVARGRLSLEAVGTKLARKSSVNSRSSRSENVVKSILDPPPSVTLPFPVPDFVSTTLSNARDSAIRVVHFDSLLQMRPLCSALTKSGFELVHRSSRYSSSRFVIQDPHLITSGTSCVFYFKLIDLIGNAVRDEAPDSTALSRQESIFTTLRRFSSLYDHILVVLEEAQGSRKSATSLKPASYTPPVLEGLSRLAPALAQLSEVSQGKVKIHVACSSGPEFSAETTRKFTNHVEREDEREARPGVVAWGERGWLTVDPQRHESSLLQLSPLLNEVNACAILSIASKDLFVTLSQGELRYSFDSVFGTERTARIYSALHPDDPQDAVPSSDFTTTSETSLLPFDPFDPEAAHEHDGLSFEDVFDVAKYDQDD